MNYYKHKDKYIFSQESHSEFEAITEMDMANHDGMIYYLFEGDSEKSRNSYAITHCDFLSPVEEGLNLLDLHCESMTICNQPKWLIDKIANRKVMGINHAAEGWEKALEFDMNRKWRVNVLGLGDVGGMLITGLKLLGSDVIEEIGIFDLDPHKLQRWEMELNQVSTPEVCHFPTVKPIEMDDLFDCDMFVFCASKFVPAVGDEGVDVRMVQFEANAKIIGTYARMAREKAFKGIFSVVSDPVDLLCNVVYKQSNTNSDGNIDHKGLAPEQVRGYGLGVMHGRAVYYGKQMDVDYENHGRAFGPHGKDLIIADDILNYDHANSMKLTEYTVTANLDVREAGFKPFIAPALSSGAISLIRTMEGKWHYSATYLGGVFWGCKNRLTPAGIELERFCVSEELMDRMEASYSRLF